MQRLYVDRTYNDVCYLQYRLEARQELAKMGLDVSRNQMLRINLQVAYV
jgi:hypothetical protein